ncbi:U3 small nucleolar RNA-associated protein 6 homolog [Plodia interpunctella]|uniref:U3 small nucleolar RNA-associated protein 6 homolog n=1 Tax=Plodia interpunctella TaxID=58824 RepID=UPI002367B58D|nr:U3 small nucleolar RNA-associated protein 6 homolog [Plodia interpunctella]
MAEQVNQRIELMINELEQMRRTNLFDDEEIRDISRKRKEFEYKLQRRVKHKEDFVQYLSYELALLEEISLRREQAKLSEKKNDIEYAIAKRLNKVFKQFIYRFQNDVEIYFEYVKFCKSVGFEQAISTIIGQMLQIHGDKPKMWQLASKWERIEQEDLATAKQFLLKGIHRHPESAVLYLELFEIELLLFHKAESPEDKEKQIKIADVVWRNGVKNVNDLTFLFKLCDLCLKYDADKAITDGIKQEIWSKRDQQEIWPYIAAKELEGTHWEEIEEFADNDSFYPKQLRNFISVYEEALLKFPDQNLCTKYIHDLLGVTDSICNDNQKIDAVKQAWLFGHEHGLLTNEMYEFGIDLLKLEDESQEQLVEILDAASKTNPQLVCIWKEKLLLNKSDDKKMLSILQEASKVLKSDDALTLWNLTTDYINSPNTLKTLHKRFQNCENVVVLAIKPKLLQKVYDHNGLKAARELYEDLIRTPPTQLEVHQIMIDIERAQEKMNVKNIRKYYECAIQHHGSEDISIWMDYMKFEMDSGNIQAPSTLYRRAIATLKKEFVDEFIKLHTLAKLK